MVNLEEINQRLAEIKEGIEYLGSLNERIIENRDRFLLGRYFLQTILEAIFTIGNQIISDAGLRKPSSYKDILAILREGDILNEENYQKLTPFADLRNRLVHTYWKISQKELLKIAEDMGSFTDFLKTIIEYLKR